MTISNGAILSFLQVFIRHGISVVTLVILSFYLFTTDVNNEEGILDQVKDFTALVIIVDIDNMLVGYTDTKKDELELKCFDMKLKDKFRRHYDYTMKLQENSCIWATYRTLKKLMKIFSNLAYFILFLIYLIMIQEQAFYFDYEEAYSLQEFACNVTH